MRIAATADLHYSPQSYDHIREPLAHVRDEADVLVIAGDLTNYGKPEEMHSLLNALVRLRLPIIAVLGNHDYESSCEEELMKMMTDEGIKVLNVTTRILPDMSTAEARTNSMKMATADRQAVFKNADCVQCHVETAKDSSGHDKMGEELYTAVCGVCHESSHRATFVPDLHHLKDPTSAAFWRTWITSGKPGTLMPAFAKIEGGPLSNEQIDSLVNYLSASIPPEPVKLSPPSGLKVVPQ